jgi:uncharacterized protein YndB with AHSA1/START domain
VVTRRSRVVGAPAEAVWHVVSDPHTLPRWWPATQRVETVSGTGWTSVFTTPRGRTVRADYSVATTEPNRLTRWRQDVEGTPFERLFASMVYEIRLAPAPQGATEVEIALDQEPRGWAQLGRWQLKRAARRQLDTALEGLAEAVERP